MEAEEEFKMTIKRWQQSSYLSEAILEDYTTEMSKLTGVDKKAIKTRIINDTNERILKAREMFSPEKIGETGP